MTTVETEISRSVLRVKAINAQGHAVTAHISLEKGVPNAKDIAGMFVRSADPVTAINHLPEEAVLTEQIHAALTR